MASDRVLGLFFVLLGAALYALIIPWQADDADYGWLKPRTLPQILAVVIGLCGVAMALRPPGDARPGNRHWGRAALFTAVLVGGLAMMRLTGFAIAAPPMALALMLLARERRPRWLASGAIAMPVLIWFVVAILLERPLP